MEVDGNSASAPRPLSAASLPSLPLISARRTDRKRVRLLSDSNSLSESDIKRMDDEAEADAKAGFYVPRGLSFSRAPPSRDNRSFLPSHAAKMAQSVIPSLLNRTDTAISAASTPSVFQPLQLQGVLAELKSQVVSLEAQNESARSEIGALFYLHLEHCFFLCILLVLVRLNQSNSSLQTQVSRLEITASSQLVSTQHFGRPFSENGQFLFSDARYTSSTLCYFS
jgi:hypothetical protein